LSRNSLQLPPPHLAHLNTFRTATSPAPPTTLHAILARGQWRGINPAAAARHSPSAAVQDLFIRIRFFRVEPALLWLNWICARIGHYWGVWGRPTSLFGVFSPFQHRVELDQLDFLNKIFLGLVRGARRCAPLGCAQGVEELEGFRCHGSGGAGCVEAIFSPFLTLIDALLISLFLCPLLSFALSHALPRCISLPLAYVYSPSLALPRSLALSLSRSLSSVLSRSLSLSQRDKRGWKRFFSTKRRCTWPHTMTLCVPSSMLTTLGVLPQATPQRTATHCNTLQHTATHCNTLQDTLLVAQATVAWHQQQATVASFRTKWHSSHS